jgi:hypothetical protein
VHAQTLNENLKELQVIESKRNANVKTKELPRMKYSKGWAILNESCMRTTIRRMSEGLVGQCILARRLKLAF